MRVMTGPNGSEIYFYEAGDLVRLKRDEQGPIVTAFAGDWGRVTEVNADGSLDIKFAGYSRGYDAAMPRAMAVPRAAVQPCDQKGRPLPRGNSAVWDTRKSL